VSDLFQNASGFFGSGSEAVVFALVVGAAALFSIYLVVDGLYHRYKWKRIQRKFRESSDWVPPE
jgi:hypothetical protein